MKNGLRLGVLIGLLGLLIGCNRIAPDGAPPDGLECGSSDWGLFGKFCSLKPSAQFLGVALGQEPRAAFRGLCANSKAVNANNWALFTPDYQRHFVSGREIRCSDLQYFQQANSWLMWSHGEPCATGSPRTISVFIRDKRVAGIHVSCRGLFEDVMDYLLAPKVPAATIAFQRAHFTASIKDGVVTYERKGRADSRATRKAQ